MEEQTEHARVPELNVREIEKSLGRIEKGSHPRKDLADWKWRGTISVILLTSMINGKFRKVVTAFVHHPGISICKILQLTFHTGYDVSNVANIQPQLYKAFGSIELLPWIGLSYSLANFAILSLARKITYCVDMRWIYLVNMIIFMVGAALSGAAASMTTVIIGRIIMGVGGAIVQQT